MNIYGRFVTLATSLLLVAGLGVTVGAGSASATVTTLCRGYTACAKAGYSSSGYATASKKMYWRMYSGHNCTNYVAYRMVQSGLSNSRPWTGSGNATNWGKAMSSITTNHPRVGAVAWWKANVSPAGSAGHVAYVERVISSSEIIVSMDSWGGDFSWGRVTKTSKGWPSGFVHFNDVKQLTTQAPAITGTSKSGSVLTASSGTWKPAGATFTYQWLQDGTSIAGATTNTLALTQAQVGKRITARVTARQMGYPTTSATSAATSAVQPGVISNTARPTISGDPRVDATLSATPGTWNPTPTQVTYQWLADGSAIAGATDSTLNVEPGLADKRISVTTTATRTGYAPVTATSVPTAAVALGTMRLVAAPTVIGTPELGKTLTLGRPSTDPNPDLRVRWLRDGKALHGATGFTYRITAADLGAHLGARVLMSHAGYQPLRARTNRTDLARSAPAVRVTTRPGSGRLAISTVVRAHGIAAVNAEMTVVSRGKLLATLHVRNGHASVTLSHLAAGTRTFSFRLAATQTTLGLNKDRQLHIS